ncbi:MAG: PD-(D/E)XK nuclease family protein [Armatimonadetes bacterium]|nr:PD-(D/E)XK nuclease family protein [Armatimonadota bacterium]
MARKPTISPTKITTYLACPVKYKWTYVDPRGKWFMRAKSYYSFGSSLHSVLQRFHDEGDKGVQTKEQALAKLAENWVTAGYATPEEAAEALAEGRELIAGYVDAQAERPPGIQTIFLEKQLRDDLGEFVLIGRVDRVDELEDGSLEIIDYKSGRDATEPDELRDDIAMNCYQLLVRSKMPGKRVLSTVIALRTQSSTTVEPSEEEVEQFKQDLLALAGEILSRDYENLVPTVKEICPECDFLPLCRRNEEFAEEYEPREG